MPRISRRSLNTNYIHLIVQGINREKIFKNCEFKDEYLRIFTTKINKTGVKILAYCIMDNHAHFLIYYSNLQELSETMKKINTTYAMKYNKKNDRNGFVFRDRYFTQPITSIKQLYNCLVYIHMNPVKAGVCNNIKEYKYSSYSEYKHGIRLIDKESTKLIFESDKDYLKQFDFIHNNKMEIEDIKEINAYKKITKAEIANYNDKIKKRCKKCGKYWRNTIGN